MRRIDEIIGIINGVVVDIGMIVIQLDHLILPHRLGIGQRRAKIIGMKGIRIILIQRKIRNRVWPIIPVPRKIISVPLVLIDRSVQIE